jgi:outer membrane murein-binding lipoprotein Lpp
VYEPAQGCTVEELRAAYKRLKMDIDAAKAESVEAANAAADNEYRS